MNTAKFRERLIKEREVLEALSDTGRDSRNPVVLDQTSVGRLSRMDAIQVQAMAIESERRRQTQIKRIEAALKRIDEGEFGYCLRCGEEIPEKRLEIDPTALLCTRCAAGDSE